MSNWDWNVIGNRATTDLNKIKKSRSHHWDLDNGCWSTEYLGGRSKLHGQKSRSWRAWRLCMCPNGQHRSPRADLLIGEDGNPIGDVVGHCTTCPVAAGEFLARLQAANDFGVYKKWNRRGFGVQNEADVVNIAKKWLVNQRVMTWQNPFCRNSGRKALAAWCDLLDVPYYEGVHIYMETSRRSGEDTINPTSQQIS